MLRRGGLGLARSFGLDPLRSVCALWGARCLITRSGPTDPRTDDPLPLLLDQPDAAGRVQETKEQFIVSGHTRDLTNADEPFTASRADSIGEALKLLTHIAIEKTCAI